MSKFTEIVADISLKRKEFISNFEMNSDFIVKNLEMAYKDNELNSIRVHKYLTETKFLGKVETARYLDNIGLTEKTMIKELTNENIMNIKVFIDSK